MTRRTLGWILAALVVAVGCHRQTGTGGQPKAKAPPKISADETAPPAPAAKAVEPPPPPTIPKVALTDDERKTCKANVGDAFPEPQGELRDLEGKPASALTGEKLAVVLFWKAENVYAAQALSDLAADVATPFGPKGVKVVSVNVGDSPDAAKKVLDEAGAKPLASFLDPQGKFFERLVAGAAPPRIFLLDAQGKILWFDVIYRQSTREDLLTALGVALGKG